nr:VCBS repeat-containing protein [Nonomuraea candida]
MQTTATLRLLLTTASAALALGAGLAAPAVAAAPDPAKPPEPEVSLLFDCGRYAENRTTTRSETLTRSRTWIDERVPYSQAACHDNKYGSYRTDCSGYVSMVWGLRSSYTTATLDQVSHPIDRAGLRPGDALLRPGHVALFIGWADAARTKPLVREQMGGDGTPTVERVWTQSYAATYTPVRYDKIAEDALGSSLSGDGKADIATVLPSGEVKAWRNGAGFAAMPWDADAIIATGFTNDNLHFADLDGDRKAENGAGFAAMPWDADAIIATGFTNDNLHFADLDGDHEEQPALRRPRRRRQVRHHHRPGQRRRQSLAQRRRIRRHALERRRHHRHRLHQRQPALRRPRRRPQIRHRHRPGQRRRQSLAQRRRIRRHALERRRHHRHRIHQQEPALRLTRTCAERRTATTAIRLSSFTVPAQAGTVQSTGLMGVYIACSS